LTTYEWADVRVRFLTPEEGGRVLPVHLQATGTARYMPHLRVGSDGEMLGIAFMRGPSPLRPAVDADASVVFLYTDTGVDYRPLTEGTSFDILEGRRVVGRGTILRRYQRESGWLDPASETPLSSP
jgi:hypothetical protein